MTDPRRSSDNPSARDQQVIRIGTRGSPLALVQARQTAAALEAVSGGAYRGEIVTFTTTGDQLTTERLINSGGKGLFTKEIDAALDDGRIDLAVHSLKDVPSQLPDGQTFVAFPQRADPREGLLSAHGKTLADLPHGATLGTASLRREAQSLAARPDLNIVTFRGNVATRMRKLEEGQADATFLAMAGLDRLGMAHFAHAIALTDMLPAPSQGIIGIVSRANASADWQDVFARLDHAPTRLAATAERAFLTALDGSCRTPIAAHLFDEGEAFRLVGEVLAVDGQQVWRDAGSVPKGAAPDAFTALGQAIGGAIREAAGDDLPAFEDTA